MAHCILCQRQITAGQSVTRGVGSTCWARYENYLSQYGTSEAEISYFETLGESDKGMATRLRGFHIELANSRAAMRCLAALRRYAGHKEAEALGLSADEALHYAERREQGESAEELRAEIEEADRAIAQERARYLVETEKKMVLTLLEAADSRLEQKRAGESFLRTNQGTDQAREMKARAVGHSQGFEEALVLVLAQSDLSISGMVALAEAHRWYRVARLIEREAGRIAHHQNFRRSIESRLQGNEAAALLLAA